MSKNMNYFLVIFIYSSISCMVYASEQIHRDAGQNQRSKRPECLIAWCCVAGQGVQNMCNYCQAQNKDNPRVVHYPEKARDKKRKHALVDV